MKYPVTPTKLLIGKKKKAPVAPAAGAIPHFAPNSGKGLYVEAKALMRQTVGNINDTAAIPDMMGEMDSCVTSFLGMTGKNGV